MTIVLDTSVLAAFVNPKDPLRKEARAILERCATGEYGRPVSPEYVLVEGLTLLQHRRASIADSRNYAALFTGAKGMRSLVQPLRTGRDELGRALELHFEHYARRLSVVDCVLLGLARELRAPIATFDSGFDGMVERVSE